MYSPHSADFTRSPIPRDFSWAQTATLCRGVVRTVRLMSQPAKLSAHFSSHGENTTDCRSFGWQDISSSGLATKTLIFFIWEQIIQQCDKSPNDCRYQFTFHRGRHNVHVCKQLAGSVFYDIQSTPRKIKIFRSGSAVNSKSALCGL